VLREDRPKLQFENQRDALADLDRQFLLPLGGRIWSEEGYYFRACHFQVDSKLRENPPQQLQLEKDFVAELDR
jgi:hypothetical protein